jgi:thioredoxin:protein disulfide reductase
VTSRLRNRLPGGLSRATALSVGLIAAAGLLVAALMALSALRGPATTTQAQQVLPPEQAFPYAVEATENHLLLRFDVTEGYYLYRERFDFSSATDGVTLDTPRYPAGRIYTDEWFGEMEIYRGRFEIAIPFSRARPVEQMTLELTLQGCADAGLCYPPQDWTSEVILPPGPVSGADSFAAPTFLGELLTGRPGGPADMLPPEQAFVVNPRFDGANQLTVSWQIAPGYYLYRDKFELSSSEGIELGTLRLPAGVAHSDQNFGDVEVFYDYVEVEAPFSRASPDETRVTLTAVYQGCKDESICYPPMEQQLDLLLPAASEFAPPVSDAAPVAAPMSEQDRLAALVLSDSWWLVLGTFYGFGLLLAFTPCVLPMVPILSGIIAGHGQVSAGRGFALSLSFVLGMAVTYTGAGALAALAGEQIQAIFQRPWIITLFAGLFVGLALAMFGVFQLQMPAAVQSRVASLANRQRAGTFAGTAVMGALSALIVTTCVAPPLVAALAVIGQSGDVTRGAGALFALSMGMGSPLLVVGAAGGKLLPKVGPWMNVVKAVFGVMLLGVAIWMLERVLPGSVTLALWAVLVFLTGIFMGAFEPLPATPTPTRRLAKGLGMLACLYGALLLIGAALGGQDPLRPIPQGTFAGGGTGGAVARLQFQSIDSVPQLETALAEARAMGRPVMVDFTADWCVSCKEMERTTFVDDRVVAALSSFTLLKADVTANNDDDKALLRYFGSYGPPTIAFFDASGRELEAFKLVGFVRAREFAAHVEQVATL